MVQQSQNRSASGIATEAPTPVLVIGVDAVGRQTIEALFAQIGGAGFVLDRVDDLLGAVDALSTGRHEVALMGEMPGEGLLETARELVPLAKRAPVILLLDEDRPETETEAEAEAEAFKIGVADVLTLNLLSPNGLRRAVFHAINRKRTQDRHREEKDSLIRTLLEAQDTKDRIEQQAAEYVALTEDLAAAKSTLERLNQEKNKFFSIIAHDLRSPFTALLGLTQFMAMSSGKLDPAKMGQYAKSVNDSAKRVFALLQNLLEWARMQMDRAEPRPVDFMLGELVMPTLEVLGPVAAEKGLTLSSRVPADFALRADRDMIQTVIRNLVSNAIKFTPAGGTIGVEAAIADGRARIAVVDSGVGMTEEQRAKLFRMDQHLSTLGTGGEKGTGLGLLMCHDMVARNGGTIGVESEPGKGSRFHFDLPLPEEAG
ncbi:MAG: HAMP domain-containing histidine kinase [Alphaproteobacteria bacterium]|nr:HAMP domain-containing histidine kinase [Alphaproteobacteria bacterium]